MKRKSFFYIPLALAMLTACSSNRFAGTFSRERLLIDSRYDARPDSDAAAFIAPYKQQVDSLMNPVVGRIARSMTARRPESELSNLMADIMVWGAKDYDETPDFGVYNIGGIRASFVKGDVTRGNVTDVAPFENKICFLTLSGADVMQLFREIARQGGEGVSRGVKLVITSDGKLVSASLNGESIDEKRDYRLVTIDYLAQGADNMFAFRKKRQFVSPQEAKNNSREIIMNYFRSLAAQGEEVDAKIEGRITIAQ